MAAVNAASRSNRRRVVGVAVAAAVALSTGTSFLAQKAPVTDALTTAKTVTLAGSRAMPAAQPVVSPVAGGGVSMTAGWAAAAATCVAMGGAKRGASSVAMSAEAAAAAAPAKPKKIRIEAFDSIRFFLIAYIVCGHFGSFAAPSNFAMKAITQINVVVGAFFVLSGYVAAYTTTENGESKPDPRLTGTPAAKWILQRVFGYYPLHLLVALIFAPMFLYPDVLFSGWPTAIGHMVMSLTMTQAWFPMHAEVWNAPTWFLSALTFAMAIMYYVLPVIARQTKDQLRRTLGITFLVGLLPKLAYCYDHNAWGFLEGAMSPKALPIAIFNTQRFNPFYALIELMLGAIACRLVMLDGAEGEKAPKTNVMSTLAPLVGMVGIVLLRAFDVIHLSDMLTRALIFIPLFIRFLMASHRNSVSKVKDAVLSVLSSKIFTTLGGLAFPIFVVHGPLGQLFYKKIIATQVFGGPLNVIAGPWFFYCYLAIVVASAWVLQKAFLSNKKVGEIAGNAVNSLAAKL